MDFVARKTSKNTSYVGAICYGQMCPGGVEIFHMCETDPKAQNDPYGADQNNDKYV